MQFESSVGKMEDVSFTIPDAKEKNGLNFVISTIKYAEHP